MGVSSFVARHLKKRNPEDVPASVCWEQAARPETLQQRDLQRGGRNVEINSSAPRRAEDFTSFLQEKTYIFA